MPNKSFSLHLSVFHSILLLLLSSLFFSFRCCGQNGRPLTSFLFPSFAWNVGRTQRLLSSLIYDHRYIIRQQNRVAAAQHQNGHIWRVASFQRAKPKKNQKLGKKRFFSFPTKSARVNTGRQAQTTRRPSIERGINAGRGQLYWSRPV